MENDNQLSQNKGLLQRAQNILAEITPPFNVWLKKNGFKRAAVLSPVDTKDGRFYYATDSYGIDAKSMAIFHESLEFWRETLSKTFEWQCFSSDFNELDKFQKFFSDDFFSRINKIFFLPFGDECSPYIFVTVELEEDADLALDEASIAAVHLKNIKEFQNNENKVLGKIESNIENGLEISQSRLFILSLKNWIEYAIKDISFANAELKNAAIEAVADAVCVNIAPLIRHPNCIRSGKNGEIKIVLYAKEDPDEELVAYHISRSLKDFLGEPSDTSKAAFLAAGICPNKKGTIAFLMQE